MDTVDQPTATPTRKVGAGFLGGFLASVIVWVANDFGGVVVPPEIAAGFATACAFGLSYVIKEREI